MATKSNGVKINGSIKIIGLIVLLVGQTVAVVSSYERTRGEVKANTTAIVETRRAVEKLERRMEEKNHVWDEEIKAVEDLVIEHIKEDK